MTHGNPEGIWML